MNTGEKAFLPSAIGGHQNPYNSDANHFTTGFACESDGRHPANPHLQQGGQPRPHARLRTDSDSTQEGTA